MWGAIQTLDNLCKPGDPCCPALHEGLGTTLSARDPRVAAACRGAAAKRRRRAAIRKLRTCPRLRSAGRWHHCWGARRAPSSHFRLASLWVGWAHSKASLMCCVLPDQGGGRDDDGATAHGQAAGHKRPCRCRGSRSPRLGTACCASRWSSARSSTLPAPRPSRSSRCARGAGVGSSTLRVCWSRSRQLSTPSGVAIVPWPDAKRSQRRGRWYKLPAITLVAGVLCCAVLLPGTHGEGLPSSL